MIKRKTIQRITIGLFLLCLAQLSFADEIRPGYLEIKENSENVFSVLWKVPAKGDKKLSIQPKLPDNCTNKTPTNTQLINASYIQRWIITCENKLQNKTLSITGLKIKTYTSLGIEHILLGVDHLLFVFALLLIVSDNRRLLLTITAFTIAHSITLAGATLGYIQLPQQPVEAIIALSILFLAMEIIHGKNEHPGAAARWPWLIAFIFGLLHGFGFAGALAEVGLPQQAIPLALIFFNIGVELGQILFVATILFFGWILHRLKQPALLERSETVATYAIGSLSSFWLFERISAF